MIINTYTHTNQYKAVSQPVGMCVRIESPTGDYVFSATISAAGLDLARILCGQGQFTRDARSALLACLYVAGFRYYKYERMRGNQLIASTQKPIPQPELLC